MVDHLADVVMRDTGFPGFQYSGAAFDERCEVGAHAAVEHELLSGYHRLSEMTRCKAPSGFPFNSSQALRVLRYVFFFFMVCVQERRRMQEFSGCTQRSCSRANAWNNRSCQIVILHSKRCGNLVLRLLFHATSKLDDCVLAVPANERVACSD